MIEHITLTRCDRCGNKIAAIEGTDEAPDKELQLSYMLDGDGIAYTDLCKRCRKLAERCFNDLLPPASEVE